MNKQFFSFFLVFFSIIHGFAQQASVKGVVKDMLTSKPVDQVLVQLEGTALSTLTNDEGEFIFSLDIPTGEQVLLLSKNSYFNLRIPITINQEALNFPNILLEVDDSNDELFTITLSDDELNDDSSGADNISGLLSASQDIFQRAAAFEFSSSFFRVRGLNTDNGTVLMNGIEMNKIFDGRPQWSNWGGLNDVLRSQELSTGLAPSSYNFGGLLGSTNINLRASNYRSGGRITYSSSNRSYTNRLMATYASGTLDGGWSYAFTLGRRWGNEGFQDGTFYDANSFFVSVEKKLNDKHSLNLVGFYTPNRRGKSSPNTQEVFDLKGTTYNEYWGFHDGEKRNSRIRRIAEPVVMLNHYWDLSEKTSLNTNIAYQFGELGNSRLDYAGGANPSPAYYQGLPSYFLADDDGPDYAGAYLAEQSFRNGGQVNWNRIYDANLTNNINGDYAAYVLYEDRSDDNQLTINTILESEISEHVTFNGSLNYKRLSSHNFAEIIDMLGSNTGYLNVDSFDQVQFDLQNPNLVVGEGDTFRYNYNIEANVLSGFAQAQFKYNKVDFFIAGSYTETDYQREGLYQTQTYANNSFGKGRKLSFGGVGAKGGFTYKFSGKHIFNINAGYISKAPSIRNTFTNSRENHSIVGDKTGIDITEEKITSFDANYIFRSSTVKARLTGYYTQMQDANEISFYFADGISGVDQGTAFVQEILQGIDKTHFGMEFGIEAQVTPTIKLTGVASMGQFSYDNNPNLVLTSSDFVDGLNFGESNLKDYRIAAGPQQAASFGFEYRDPNYWWFGTTANFFSNTYVDVSPLTRTQNFFLDTDGLPFSNYDSDLARELLNQEKFEDYMVINAIGGKSWKVGDKYISLFVSLNNILNQKFKSGGFEQGRSANYQSLTEDSQNPKRVFGPKYWYGRGPTYFLNLNYRF
ncbi:MAG: TonB-dependent receptor [Flavobacteriaceae bacterium]|nr:TonB-dependent receptor [Flavobacteriaceae bacterium]|tara:strand:+ start:30492 stop:33245 length:2754 start_codon:yes stop_codon:yes gene_type:complete